MKNRCFNNFRLKCEAVRFKRKMWPHTCRASEDHRQGLRKDDSLHNPQRMRRDGVTPPAPISKNRKVNCWKISRERNKNNLVKLHIRFVQRKASTEKRHV